MPCHDSWYKACFTSLPCRIRVTTTERHDVDQSPGSAHRHSRGGSIILARGIETLAVLALTLGTDTVFAPDLPSSPNTSSSTASPPRTRVTYPYVDTRYHPRESESRCESDGLSSLHPLSPGRIPVVFVNGLWGSPAHWAPMVKALESDPFLSRRFQFLTFGYSTGDPIPYSSHLLRRSLRALRDRVDAGHSDPSWDRMVLIGHSLGGVICKMMTQDSGSKLWDLTTILPFEKLKGPAEARELLHSPQWPGLLRGPLSRGPAHQQR
jgi:hypothetical protein